jgi:hypothetical protein
LHVDDEAAVVGVQDPADLAEAGGDVCVAVQGS